MSTEKETALVTIEPVNALAVFTTPEKVDPILAAIKKAAAVVSLLSTGSIPHVEVRY
jgi:hypothetical protein